MPRPKKDAKGCKSRALKDKKEIQHMAGNKNEIRLANSDKQFLKSIGYKHKDMKQIEDACNKSTFAIFKRGVNSDECRIISNNETKELLGNEEFLSLVSRSAFQFSATKIVPKTFMEYSVIADSGEMLNGKPSRLTDYKKMEETVNGIKAIQNFPHIYATNIAWDVDYDEDYEYLPTVVEIPMNIWIEFDDSDYVEGISDYISDVTGYCHEGFTIECNLNIEELYDLKERIDNDLSKEYEDGETNWAANLECILEEIDSAIIIMEAESDRDIDEIPLDH